MGVDPSEYPTGELAFARSFTRRFSATRSASLLSTGSVRSARALFTSIEQSGFLLEQIAVTDSFSEASQTLERHALPIAIAEATNGDSRGWLRFLHYALIGANLRGAAESLAEPEILQALVRRSKLSLARSIAEQLPRSSQRATALAAVTAALDVSHPLHADLLQATANELELQPWPASRDVAETWRETIEAVAGELPLQLEDHWLEWLDRLADHPELRSAAQEAVIGAWLAAGEPAPWRIAQAVQLHGDSGTVREQLVWCCAMRVATDGLTSVLSSLAEVRTELGELYWHAAMTAFAAATAPVPEIAVAGLQELLAAEQPALSPALVERGAALWCHLDEPQLRDLEYRLDDPESRCALRVCSFEGKPDLNDWPAVRAAVAAVQPGDTQLHWALRAVQAGALRNPGLMRQPLSKITHQLAQNRYVAPPRTLVHFLDLVALVTPDQLQRQLENVLWSPQVSEDLLRIIVTRTRSRRLQELLFARIESHAAQVAGTDAEGFILRRELLTELTARLSVQDSDLIWLESAIPRCATSELDRLKSTVAVALARAGQPEIARSVVEGDERTDGIASYRVRLLTLLRMGVDRAQLDELLSPASLYRAAADATAIEDEVDALTALCLEPLHPAEVASACLSGIHDGTRRLLAHVDLAWHALRHEQRGQPRSFQDPSAALLPLRDALRAMPSLELGAALAAEQVRLAADLGLRETLGNLKESFTRLARRSPLAWECRYTTLVVLLATMVRVLTSERTAAPPEGWHAAASLLAWLLELPGDASDEDRQELREHWHRVFPLIVAATELMPNGFWWSLRHPLLARIGIAPGAALLEIAGKERGDRLLAWCDERWDTDGCRRLLLGRWHRIGEEGIVRCWSWLDDNQLRIVSACLQHPDDRRRLAAQLVTNGGGEQDLVTALAYVLAPTRPQLAIDLLRLLPRGSHRDRLGEHLLRCDWIDRQYLDDIVQLIADEVAIHRADALCGNGGRQRKALYELIAADQADPLDPVWSDLRRDLWSQLPETDEATLEQLARAVLPALDRGGKAGCERALRWWLQAFFRPRLGQKQPDWQQQREIVRTATRRSQRIGPVTDGHAIHCSGDVSEE